MWKWLKRHPRLYAIGGVLMVIGGGLATIEGVWGLFSSDPLFPFIYDKVSPFLPTWPRILLIMWWLLVAVFGIMLLVQVIRQTKKGQQESTSSLEIEPLRLIDSFPKDNGTITMGDIKKIFLKFNKPIDKETEGLIGNYYIKGNSWCQWNIGGWIQYAEEDTKLIWHVESVNKDQFVPMEVDYPTFEIRIPHSSKNLGLRATDGSRLPRTIIRVKIKPDALPSQVNGIQPIVLPSPELKPEIYEHAFGLAGDTGYPPRKSDDDKTLWLRLGVGYQMNQTMRIETLYLLLSGESIQPHDWKPPHYYCYLEIPQWVKPGDVRTIQLVAFAKGIKWGSDEEEIRFTLPPQ